MHGHVRCYHYSSASVRFILICFGGYLIITFDYPIMMQSNDLLTNVCYVTNNVKQCENVNFRVKHNYFLLYIFWVINKNWIIRLFCYGYCFLPSIYMYNICDILYDLGACKKLYSCRKVKVIIKWVELVLTTCKRSRITVLYLLQAHIFSSVFGM